METSEFADVHSRIDHPLHASKDCERVVVVIRLDQLQAVTAPIRAPACPNPTTVRIKVRTEALHESCDRPALVALVRAPRVDAVGEAAMVKVHQVGRSESTVRLKAEPCDAHLAPEHLHLETPMIVPEFARLVNLLRQGGKTNKI